MVLAYILVFTLIGSIASLVGCFFLLLKKTLTQNFSNKLISFAAGVMIATAFVDILPEAQEVAGNSNIYIPALVGFVTFFLAERLIRLFHFHHGHGEKPSTFLVLIGDGVHNFIDGVTMTTAFLTSIPLGITASLAVAAHEIPQEIGDMGVLLANGLSKSKALFFNFLSALTALAGALLAFYFADYIRNYLYIFLAIAAGNFIYISASDLIPEIHEKFTGENKYSQIVIFMFGVVSVIAFTRIFEG